MPFVAHTLLAAIMAAIVAGATGGFLWWILGRPSLSSNDSLDSRSALELVKLSLAAAAGLGGVVALVVAYRKQQFHEVESWRDHTKQCNERFGRATDQLGSERPAVRLAGVHAVAGLADDWPAGRQTCVDVLCAYLRMPYSPPWASQRDVEAGNEPSDLAEGRARREEQQVRHTVIRVIGTRLRADADVSWSSLDFDFTGAVFDGGDLSNANFTGGEVSFRSATFSGPNFSFSEARFSGGTVLFSEAHFAAGGVYFGGAHFCGAHVYFSGARITGGLVSLAGARLSSGRINFDTNFVKGELSFNLADFSGTDISFEGARFLGATVDLSSPRSYVVPPRFDNWSKGRPAGLRLPVS